MKKTIFATIMLLVLLSMTATAYSGYKLSLPMEIKNGGARVTGTLQFTYKLYDAATGGNLLYTRTVNETVSDGLVNAELPTLDSVDHSKTLYLEITIGVVTLSPRVELTPAVDSLNNPWNFNGSTAWPKNTSTRFLYGGSELCTAGNGLCSGSSSTAGWTSTSTMTSTGLNVNITAGNLTIPNGRIGVGTTNPAYELDVKGMIRSSNSNNVGILYLGSNPNVEILGTSDMQFHSKDNFIFTNYNGSSYGERMRIDNQGNVGIGTSSPASKLDVDGNLTVADRIDFTNPNSIFIGASQSSNPLNAVGIGSIAEATGDYSTVIGYNAKDNGFGEGVAIAPNSQVMNSYGIAIGYGTQAYSDSVAIGKNTITGSSGRGVAIGDLTKGTGFNAVAIAAMADASGNSAFALGYNANAAGQYATAVGFEANASKQSSVALGSYATVDSNNQFMIGSSAYPLNIYTYGNAFFQPQLSTDVGLTVKGAVSQSADLQEWNDNESNVLASVDANGNVALSSATGNVFIGSGSLKSGMAGQSNGRLSLYSQGTSSLQVWPNGLVFSPNNGYPFISKEMATATNPVYGFYADTDTGLGWAGADNLSIITGGVEAVRITDSQDTIHHGWVQPGECDGTEVEGALCYNSTAHNMYFYNGASLVSMS